MAKDKEYKSKYKGSDIDRILDKAEKQKDGVTKEYVDGEVAKKPSINDGDIKTVDTTWSSQHSAEIITNLVNTTNKEFEKLKDSQGAILTTEVTLTSSTQNTNGHYVKFKAENGDIYYSEEINKFRVVGESSFNFTIKLQPDLYGHLEIVDDSGTLFKSAPFITQSGRADYAFFCDYNTKTYIFDGVSSQGTLEAIKANSGSGGVTKEYVDSEVAKKPSINDGTPTNDTTWSGQHSAEIITNIVGMANKELEKKIAFTDIADLESYIEPDMNKKVPSVFQTGYMLHDLSVANKQTFDETREHLNLYIRSPKGTMINKLEHSFNIVKTNTNNTDYNVTVPFSKFEFLNNPEPSYDLWTVGIKVVNDLTFRAEFFNKNVGNIISISDEFISHAGRDDREIILEYTSDYHGGFVEINSVDNGMINKSKELVSEVIKFEVYIPEGFDYSNCKIICEDTDFGYQIGVAELKYFKQLNKTLLTGKIVVEPNYNCVMYLDVKDIGHIESPKFTSIANRSIREAVVDVAGKAFLIRTSDENIIDATKLNYTEAIKKSMKVDATINVILPAPDYNVGEDIIQFMDNNTDNPYFEIKVKDVIKTGKNSFVATIPPDVYGHFELSRGGTTVARTIDIVSSVGRNDYVFSCNYNDNTFVMEQVPMGVLEAIQANGGGGITIHNELKALQGGKTGGKGEYFHLNSEMYSRINQLEEKKSLEVNRLFTKDSENNIANLVSQSDFSVLYGNRLVSNTQFSNFKNGLKHVYNDGMIDLYRPVNPAMSIPAGDYELGIAIRGKTGGTISDGVEGLKITKVTIECDDRDNAQPQIGNIALFDNNDKILWKFDSNNESSHLVDTYGNYKGKVVFDVSNPISINYGDKVLCRMLIVSDGVKGDITVDWTRPSVALTVEQLQEKVVAKVDDIAELAHDVYEVRPEYFRFTGEDATIAIDVRGETLLTSVRGELIVPKIIQGKVASRITETIRDDGKIRTFRADGITHIENTTVGEALFYDNQTIEEIHFKNLVLTNMRFAEGCPALRKVYVYNCNVRDLVDPSVDFGLINACGDVVFYFNSDNIWMQKACDRYGYNYKYLDIPSSSGKEAGSVLALGDDKLPYWSKSAGGGSKVADSTINGNILIDDSETVVYEHPVNHLATMITQDEFNRFVSDGEKENWNKRFPVQNIQLSDISSRPLTEGYYPQVKGNLTSFPVVDRDFALWNGNKDQTLVDKTNGDVYTRVYVEPNWTAWKKSQSATDNTLSTYNKEIPKAINEIQNGLRCVTGVSIQYDPLGESLTTQKPVTQAQIQAYYDANKSKSGFLSPDTTNPLALYPDLPPIPTGKYAFWLGENKWYYKVGDGTNNGWSAVNEWAKGGLAFTPVYIAIGVGKGYSTFEKVEAIGKDAFTIFVDATTGVDTNDGSASKPIKTLAEAVKRLPANCLSGSMNNVNLNGDFSTQTLTVSNKNSIMFYAKDVSNKPIIKNFTFNRCRDINLANLSIAHTDGTVNTLNDCSKFNIGGCVSSFASSSYFIGLVRSTDMIIRDCNFSNKTRVLTGAICSVKVINCTGDNTVVAELTQGSDITVVGTKMTGTMNLDATCIDYSDYKTLAKINDTTASTTSAYSSTKIDGLISNVMPALTFLDGDKSVIDFKTCFKNSGMFRVYNATTNMPTGYPSKNSDFYCSVYYTADKWIKIMASDVRSSRMFTISMVNGTWNEWMEVGVLDDTTALATKTWSAKKTSDELAKKQDIIIPSNPAATDINTVFNTKTESYKIGFSNLQSTGLPTGITSGNNIVVLEGVVFYSRHRQILHDMNSNKSFTRQYSTASGWTAWSSISA